jgi:hypothetical protein
MHEDDADDAEFVITTKDFIRLKQQLEEARSNICGITVSKDVYVTLRKRLWKLNDAARVLHLRVKKLSCKYPAQFRPTIPQPTNHTDYYLNSLASIK